MQSVRFSSPINSTTFTTCCQVAIGAERYCPRCGEEVTGWYPDIDDQTVKYNRFRTAMTHQKRGEFA